MATKSNTPEVATPEDAQASDSALKKAAKDDGAKTVPAADRAGVNNRAATQGGFIDQMSRRSDSDALEGHAVTVDLDNKDVKKAFEAANLADHTGNYGVYIQPVQRDSDTGIPTIAEVRLRDETHALVHVPYEALTPADHRGR